MIILEKNKNVKRIYHVSDIHIRKTERYEEYSDVFESLYEKINKDENNEFKGGCLMNISLKLKSEKYLKAIIKELKQFY